VRELNTDISDWIADWNENPRPYVWTKTAEQILESSAATAAELMHHDTSLVGPVRRCSEAAAQRTDIA
jgi:hypothetical protein